MDIDAHRHRKALAACHKGHFAEAEAICRIILAATPASADAWRMIGILHDTKEQPGLAIRHLKRAWRIDPASARVHDGLGNAYAGLDRFLSATEHFRRALAIDPGAAATYTNFGNCRKRDGDPSGAVEFYVRALRADASIPGVHYNLANVLYEAGLMKSAEYFYQCALQSAPNAAEIHYNLGNVLYAVCRTAEALAAYRTAVSLQWDFAEAYNNIGNILHDQNRLEEAASYFKKALCLKPALINAHHNLGSLLLARNRPDEAHTRFRRSTLLAPSDLSAHFLMCLSRLPIVYTNEEEINRRRQAYAGDLERLRTVIDDAVNSGGAPLDGGTNAGANQPFFLPYQGRDDRPLQETYGLLAARVATRAFPRYGMPSAIGERVRVGIVSGFFHSHTVWHLLISGWLSQLDRDRFEIIGYHTGGLSDAATASAERSCAWYVHRRMTPRQWADRIHADAPHVLLYPEIGIDPMAAQLAAIRLAPVQCSSWGHPNTSGLPTVDVFLSSEMMEPSNGCMHYSEKLELLPNLSTYYEPPDWTAARTSRAEFGLRDDVPVFWSGQALYKYLPQYDSVFPRIAREVGDCQFVFIGFGRCEDVTALFRRRLGRAFSDYGLDASAYCVFLPSLPQARFLAAIGVCDVILDTIGWSGGRSTLEALAHDLPVVTLPGAFMRGRHGDAILRRIGVTETIAGSVDGYVALAAELARNPDLRRGIGERMRHGKPRIYRDCDYIAALSAFLDRAARRATVMLN